jgi:hypothetical protein
MPEPAIAPGLRLSTVDIIVLVVGVVGSILFGLYVDWIGYVIGFTHVHFFLFCNVFRISRALELAWAAVFVTLCVATILLEQPGWYVTIGISLCMTILVIVLEMRKPSYHGIGWRTINPGLEAWWMAGVKSLDPHP